MQEYDVRVKYLIAFLIAFGLLSTWPGCTFFVKHPGEPTLRQLSLDQIYFQDWTDDLNYNELEKAIDQSISYYSRLSGIHRFHYNGIKYSPEDMVASMNLFMDIINNSGEGDGISRLKEKFLFFESTNSQGEAFFTGYYEPLLEGSLIPSEEFPEPVYGIPDDLIEVELGLFSDKWKNETIVGRLQGNQLVPYFSRQEIVVGKSLKDSVKPIAYVNGIELFFLQIQGSGLVKMDDGNQIRINYAQKNGHPYRSIGRKLKDKIPEEEISLQSIKSYLYDNPEEVQDILNYNQSYVFFRETEEGPLGSIEVPLTPHRSIAMDKRVIPEGSLAYIETKLPVIENGKISDWRPVRRFVLVQDTGGAIQDHGRVDLFLGNGEEAELTAGHLKRKGRVFLLVARKKFLESYAYWDR